MSLSRLYKATPTYPAPINEELVARNGQRVSGPTMRHIQQSWNSIMAYRRKVVFCQGADLANVPPSPSTDAATDRYWFAFRTGYNVKSLVFHIGLAQADTAPVPASGGPYCRIGITPSGGSEHTTDSFFYPSVDTTPTDVPNNFHWGKIFYGIDDDTPLLENTEYYCRLQLVNRARPIAMTVYEIGKDVVDTSDSTGVHARTGSGSPVIDEDFEHMMIAQTNAWKKNGAHLFSWCPEDIVGDSLTINNATAENLWSFTTTGVAVDQPTMKANLDYHNSSSATDVAVRMAVRAQRTAGAGATANNKVSLAGLSGSLEVTTIGNTAAWYTTTGTWDLNLANFVLTAETNASDTIRIDGVSVWEVE